MENTIALDALDTLVLSIQCPADLASYLGETLWGLDGVQSVLEELKDEEIQGLKVYTQEPTCLAAVQALLNDDLRFKGQCCLIDQAVIRTEDWAESWKQYWHVTPVTPRLTICPTWESYTPERSEEQVILLDPGCAFGTGTHETTRLMLQGLDALSQELSFPMISLLDVGTGSGILAIAAAKLGCGAVMGIDNDPIAVKTAQDNAQLNNVVQALHLSDTPLNELCQTKHEVVLANIIAPVILELFSEMCLRLKPNGVLLLSGLIESALPSIKEAMAQAGFTDIQQTQQGDWYALRGTYHP